MWAARSQFYQPSGYYHASKDTRFALACKLFLEMRMILKTKSTVHKKNKTNQTQRNWRGFECPPNLFLEISDLRDYQNFLISFCSTPQVQHCKIYCSHFRVVGDPLRLVWEASHCSTWFCKIAEKRGTPTETFPPPSNYPSRRPKRYV